MDDEPKNMFHEDNVQQAQLLMLMRIYDVLAAIAFKVSPEIYEEVEKIHSAGGLFADPPYLSIEDE